MLFTTNYTKDTTLEIKGGIPFYFMKIRSLRNWNKKKKYILENFDFEKAYSVLNFLKWTWIESPEQLKSDVECVLTDLIKKFMDEGQRGIQRIHSSAFIVEIQEFEDGELSLYFNPITKSIGD